MEQLSFFEKLGVLFDNIIAHPLFICILLIPVLLIFFNKKITKKAVVLIYIGVLAIILFIGNTTIFALFDNLVDGIFMTLYFPNFITLFLVEVLSAIICLVTFLKKDITKLSKIINITGFAIIQTLFALILTVIQANDIDIYKENALYANNDVLTLMQLLMGTFALQIVTLLVIKAIDKVTAKLDGTAETEIIEKHTLKLSGMKIGHAKLNEKMIIREPVLKEPEIKLDPVKPIKPLDKSLIENVKINPVNLNDEIIKEENRPKPTIKKDTSEVLDTKQKEVIKPTIIKETTEVLGIIPKEEVLDVKENIKPESKVKTEEVKKKANETISNISGKFKNYISKFQDKIKEAKEEKNKPILPKEEIIIPTLEVKPKEEVKPIKAETPKESINPFDNFKPEFPEAKTSKFINEEVIKEKPDLLKPMEEPLETKNTNNPFDSFKPEENVKEDTSIEKELITNLQIVDYDKTVKAIKNLSTVYTL